jgi:hypothetical protein
MVFGSASLIRPLRALMTISPHPPVRDPRRILRNYVIFACVAIPALLLAMFAAIHARRWDWVQACFGLWLAFFPTMLMCGFLEIRTAARGLPNDDRSASIPIIVFGGMALVYVLMARKGML